MSKAGRKGILTANFISKQVLPTPLFPMITIFNKWSLILQSWIQLLL